MKSSHVASLSWRSAACWWLQTQLRDACNHPWLLDILRRSNPFSNVVEAIARSSSGLMRTCSYCRRSWSGLTVEKVMHDFSACWVLLIVWETIFFANEQALESDCGILRIMEWFVQMASKVDTSASVIAVWVELRYLLLAFMVEGFRFSICRIVFASRSPRVRRMLWRNQGANIQKSTLLKKQIKPEVPIHISNINQFDSGQGK